MYACMYRVGEQKRGREGAYATAWMIEGAERLGGFCRCVIVSGRFTAFGHCCGSWLRVTAARKGRALPFSGKLKVDLGRLDLSFVSSFSTGSILASIYIASSHASTSRTPLIHKIMRSIPGLQGVPLSTTDPYSATTIPHRMLDGRRMASHD